MLIGQTVQSMKKAWIALAHSTGMQQFYNMVSSSFMFNHTGNLVELLSRKKDGYDPRVPARDLAEATGFVSKNEEVAAKVWDREAAVYKALL